MSAWAGRSSSRARPSARHWPWATRCPSRWTPAAHCTCSTARDARWQAPERFAPRGCPEQSSFLPHLPLVTDRKSTRLNSSHLVISYAVFCLKKKKTHDLYIIRVPLHHASSATLSGHL